jgi:hypothetical protein
VLLWHFLTLYGISPLIGSGLWAINRLLTKSNAAKREGVGGQFWLFRRTRRIVANKDHRRLTHAEKRGSKARGCRGSQLCGERRSVGHGVAEYVCNDLLGLIVACHHSHIHGHSSQNIWHQTCVQSADSLFFGGSDQGLSKDETSETTSQVQHNMDK